MTYDALVFWGWAVLLVFNVVMLTLWSQIERLAIVRRWAAVHAGIAATVLAYLIWVTR